MLGLYLLTGFNTKMYYKQYLRISQHMDEYVYVSYLFLLNVFLPVCRFVSEPCCSGRAQRRKNAFLHCGTSVLLCWGKVLDVCVCRKSCFKVCVSIKRISEPEPGPRRDYLRSSFQPSDSEAQLSDRMPGELIKNTSSWALPRPTESESLRAGTGIFILTIAPGDLFC